MTEIECEVFECRFNVNGKCSKQKIHLSKSQIDVLIHCEDFEKTWESILRAIKEDCYK